MTAIYGIFGWPVAHSRSPHMHNAAFAELGIDALYVPLPVPPERLPAAVQAARLLDVRGLNVTLPHKEAIMDELDAVEAQARAIGAVNTVLRDGEKLVGTNTDAEGLARSLREADVNLQGARVVVLGAGGAARAAVVGLAAAGASRVTVAARRRERADGLCDAVKQAVECELTACDMGVGLPGAFGECDLLIQGTSATLGAGEGPEQFAAALPMEELPESAVVCDLVYKPLQTTVMRRATERGLKTVDGLGMLLHQGALAFERWTGEAAPVGVMRRALLGK